MTLPSAAPPPPRIDVYKLIGTGPGYKFYGICFPTAGRNVSAFGDSEQQVINHIEGLL